ncbi:hypothetical protein MAR_033201, partial [Mya arenaria]
MEGQAGESVFSQLTADVLYDYVALKELAVAEIEDEALLGGRRWSGGHGVEQDSYSVKRSGDPVPAEGKTTKGKESGSIAEDVCVPARSEAVIDVYVKRTEEDDLDNMANSFQERYTLLMAATLVNINGATTCKARVLNPLLKEATLKQDAEIAHADRIERVVSVLSDMETSDEDSNVSNVRLVQVSKSMDAQASTPGFRS